MNEQEDFEKPVIFWKSIKPLIAESEAALQMCSYKKVFWKYAANLQENTHAKVRFQ